MSSSENDLVVQLTHEEIEDLKVGMGNVYEKLDNVNEKLLELKEDVDQLVHVITALRHLLDSY